MKLGEFLLKHTQVGELCIITSGGWPAAATEIDNEDLFYAGLNPKLLSREIASEEWDTRVFKGKEGQKETIDVHLIDLK